MNSLILFPSQSIIAVVITSWQQAGNLSLRAHLKRTLIMRISKRIPGVALLATVSSAAWLALSGCDQAAPTSSPAPQTNPASQMMPPAGGGAPVVDETGPHAAGKKVFASAGCGRCHRINGAAGPGGGGPGMGMGMGMPGGGGPGGPGGPGMGPGGPPGGGPGGRGPGGPGGRAPDLGKVGDDAEHTVEWLAAFVRDPKSQKADARMPAFGAEKIGRAH